MSNYPPTPNLNAMIAVSEDSQKIGVFLDWLGTQGYQICEWVEPEDDQAAYFPLTKSIENILAAYFEIDLAACENERRAILDHIRSKQP